MYLGPVSIIDCLVFGIFLVPQLVWKAGPILAIVTIVRALPFLFIHLPFGFIYDHFFAAWHPTTPFVQQSTLFEDFVVRCVRYAFANISPSVGRVFMSKEVILPFLKFRMARHGQWWDSVYWHEHVESTFQGIWVLSEPLARPDICIYYIHGGGFSMGSSYFYLEFLMSWVQMLYDAGYQRPAIFALEYTLVPDASFPAQLNEAFAGYEHVMEIVQDPQRLCVSGDSAGGALALALLLFLARMADLVKGRDQKVLATGYSAPAGPEMAILISPWTTLISDKHQDTPSDFLNAATLHKYARQYAGHKPVHDHLISPGKCRNRSAWFDAGVGKFFVIYGSEEVFAEDIADFAEYLRKCDIKAETHVKKGAIHVWPVISLFLRSSAERRYEGLATIVKSIKETIP